MAKLLTISFLLAVAGINILRVKLTVVQMKGSSYRWSMPYTDSKKLCWHSMEHKVAKVFTKKEKEMKAFTASII